MRIVVCLFWSIALLWSPDVARSNRPVVNLSNPTNNLVDRRVAALNGKGQEPDTPCTGRAADRSSEICAQWKAADASERAANIAFWVGIAGSTIGALTLVAALMAALYARRAANAASKAVLNSETPYLALNARQARFFPSHSSQEGLGDLWQIEIVNYGQFPAKITQVAVHSFYGAAGPAQPVQGRGFPNGFIIESGGEFHIQYHRFEEYDQATSEAVMSGKDRVWLVGFVRYQNLYGDNFVTRFRLSFDPVRKEVFLDGASNAIAPEPASDVPQAVGQAVARNPYIV